MVIDSVITIGRLGALFDASPMAVWVEHESGIVYQNGNAHGQASGEVEVASWPIQLDVGRATVFVSAAGAAGTSRLLSQTRIFEQVHDSIIQTDLAGCIQAWNRGAERMFGYRYDEVVGRHVSLLYFEEDRKDVGPMVLGPLFAKGGHEVVLRNRRKDGSECWIRLSLSLVHDRKGSACGLVGYSEDITGRRRAEAALQASEARYRRLFEASPVGIAVWRADASLAEANDVFHRLRATAPWSRLSSAALEPGQTRTFEDEWLREDGTPFPVLVGLAKQETGDSELLAYIVDLSQQKEAERAARMNREYLDLALEGADLAIWEWNFATGSGTWNERWLRMLGYEPDEIEPSYAGWERLVHPDDLPEILAAANFHMERRTPSYQVEYRLRHKSGEWRWVWTSGRVIERSAEGRAVRVAGTHLDISARKEAELALARSEQRFHAIFDQTFQFIGLLAPDGTLLEANQTALTFGGLKREDVVNRPFWEVFAWTISPETQEELRSSIRRAAAGEFVRYEVDVWAADRSVTTLDFSLCPLRDETGLVHLMIAEGRDITEMRRAQQLVHAEAEKRRLEAVLRSMTKGVIIADTSGNVLSLNPAALALMGFDSEAEAKRSFPEFREFDLRTLDGAVVDAAEWPLARLTRGETFSAYELEVRRLDTGKRFIGSFGGSTVLDDSGRPILLVQTVRDVTRQHEVANALRRSNRERDFALQAGRMRIWRWESTPGRNQELDLVGAMLGVPPGGPVLEAVHPDDRWRVHDFGRRIRDRASEIEYRELSGESVYKWRASRGQPITSERGEVSGVTGVSWDVTERKRAEAEIESMNVSLHRLTGELLRLQDEERRRLARELHDGPVQLLSAAAMNLSMLARARNLGSFTNELRLIGECVGWVKECSESMRSMSYLLHPPILDELGITSAVRGWAVGFSDRTGLEVETELEEVGRLGADSETALFRIVQEALGNVHRHSRSSTVGIRLHRTVDFVRLEVEDDGCGIPPVVLEGAGVGRVGIGIQGMRERARQLGGKFEIVSRQGGTLVRVLLPAKVPDENHTRSGS
jgi:PAS domain S-box-containing protein